MRRFLLLAVLVPGIAAADPDTDAIRAASQAFTTWHRVDERPNMAAVLCRSPLPRDYGVASHARLSTADAAPHGKKLYYRWASETDTYTKLGLVDRDPEIPVGFAIVKQSFSAKEVAREPVPAAPKAVDGKIPAPITWLDVGEHRFAIDQPKDLFVMVKRDKGWIYGTVAPDGRVTSAGQVELCTHCHVHATHERLFGLAR